MNRVPLQDLPLQYQTIKAELAPEIEKVLSSAAYILGPAVSRFEEDFAKYVGTKYCIGAGSGTDALHLAQYDGDFTYETHNFTAKMPDEVIMSGLKHSIDIGNLLIDMIQGGHQA